MYAKILVPLDGSAPSLNGLAEAIKIAQQTGARLCLFHVVNEFIFDYTYSPQLYATKLLESMKLHGNTVLDEAYGQVRKNGLQAEKMLLETIGGSTAELIVKQARDSSADLIVMGTHGRRGIRRLALGSDAEEVVRLSKIPVLLVRGETETRNTMDSASPGPLKTPVSELPQRGPVVMV